MTINQIRLMAKNKKTEEVIGLDAELRKSEAFIEKNFKTIIITLAAVIIVAVGYIFWSNSAADTEQEAQVAISKSEQLFMQQQYETALNGDGIATKGFLNIVDEYSGTKTANLATLYAGLCYYNLNKYEDAINYLSKFDPQDDQSISPSAVAALGNCYAQTGDVEKGLSTLLKAAKLADGNLAALFKLQAGMLYEGLGQTDKALDLYKDIKANHTTSPLAQSIDTYIEKLSK